MPDAARAVSGHPPSRSRRKGHPPVLTSPNPLSTLLQRFACARLSLPMGAGKTSPVSSVDVARAVAAILDDPAPHIGHIYDLTGPESADLDHYARVFSEVLGRTIRYRDAPTSEWSEKLRTAG